MTVILGKLLAPLFLWLTAGLALFRFYGDRRNTALLAGGAGFCTGVAVALSLALLFKGDLPFALMRAALGGAFIVLCAVAVAAANRAGSVSFAIPLLSAAGRGAGRVTCGAACFGLFCGALAAFRLPLAELSLAPLLVLLLAGPYLLYLAFVLERRLPGWLTLTGDTYLLLIISLFLLLAAHTLRLDLFSPLSMKVMKFIHDFVHQLFESMLFPDHIFFRKNVWDYIGYLFSIGVGFWGGLVVWLAPAGLVLWAIWHEPLPKLAHIRQGATRRKLLAGYLRERRSRLIVPWFALFLLLAAVYKSQSPAVEYWDPKPLPVAASPGGELFIPLKSDSYDLQDGRLHKFLYQEGATTVRFFVLKKGSGRLTVTLDACAICKPEGYGQAEGTLICYYCKTLIPLETVGEPGGCNPVPVPFKEGVDGVRIDAAELRNGWNSSVQGAKKVPGRRK